MFLRTTLATLAVAAAFAAPAFAGECPADQVRPAGAMQDGPTMPSGVTDTVVGEIDLGAYGAEGRNFRLRQLTIAPGGVVPMHSHAERPAHIYIISGSVTEYRSTCATPIIHNPGDLAVEAGDLTHWWRNDGVETVILISADILPAAPVGHTDM